MRGAQVLPSFGASCSVCPRRCLPDTYSWFSLFRATVKIDSLARPAIGLILETLKSIAGIEMQIAMKRLFTILIVIAAASAVHGQKVKAVANPNVNFSNYKTWAWDKPLPPGNAMIQGIIIDSIEQAMSAKGLTKVEDKGDLTLSYFAASNMDVQIGYPVFSDKMGTTAAPNTVTSLSSYAVTKGSIVVDIVDTKTKNTVWRASAVHVLKDGPSGNPTKDAERLDKPIRRSVEKMFDKFPRTK